MHIVLVTTTYPPDNGWGGIGTYIYHMSRGLAHFGNRVTVVCGYGDHPRESCDDGVRAMRVLHTDSVVPSALSRQVSITLERLIQTEPVDVIEFAEYGALGLDFQRQHPEFPTVVKLHGDNTLCVLGEWPSWKRLVSRVYMPQRAVDADRRERETVARASVVISPSKWLLDSCLSRGWSIHKDAKVVPNPMTDGPAACEGADYREKKVLWLARLDKRKGADLLPRIALQTWKAVPETEFHVIGQSGPVKHYQGWPEWIRAQIPSEARDRVILYGGLPTDEVRRRLAGFSLALFASTWENFSYAQLECMWANLACVCASGGGAGEMGSPETLITVPRDAPSISSQVVRLLENSELRKAIGCAAGQHVRQRYSADHIAEQMIEIYADARAAAGLKR